MCVRDSDYIPVSNPAVTHLHLEFSLSCCSVYLQCCLCFLFWFIVYGLTIVSFCANDSLMLASVEGNPVEKNLDLPARSLELLEKKSPLLCNRLFFVLIAMNLLNIFSCV